MNTNYWHYLFLVSLAFIWGIEDGEEISQHQVFSMFIILAGIYLIKEKEKKV